MHPVRALHAESVDAAKSENPIYSELAHTIKMLGWGFLGIALVVAIIVFDGQTSGSMFWYWVMGAFAVLAVPMLWAGYRADKSAEADQ